MKRSLFMTGAVMLILTLLTFMPKCTLEAHALSGTGTKDNPYIVTEYDELYNILMPEEHALFNNLDTYIKLGDDIIVNDEKNGRCFELYNNSLKIWTVNFDLAGHTLSRTADTKDTFMFRISSQAKLVIDDSIGGGVISCDLDCGSQVSEVIEVVGGSELIINGGTFENLHNNPVGGYATACIMIMGGDVTINDGTFKANCNVVDNQYGQTYINGGTYIEKKDNKSYSSYALRLLDHRSKIVNCTCLGVEANTLLDLPYFNDDFTAREMFFENTVIKSDGTDIAVDDLKKGIKGKEITVTAPSIDKINISITEPKAGEKPDFNATADNENVSVVTEVLNSDETYSYVYDKMTWYMGDPLTADDVFEYDMTYLAYVELISKNGYVVTTGTKVYINGREAVLDSISTDGTGIFRAEFPLYKKYIDNVEITISEPKAGEERSDEVVSSSEGIQIVRQISPEELTVEVDKFDWYIYSKEEETYKKLTDVFTYEPDNIYLAGFTMRPLDGYYIDNLTKVTVNGKIPEKIECNAMEQTLTAAFPFEIKKEAEPPVTGILGDVNNDGNIDIEDAVMVINHVNGQKALTDEKIKRADIDGNSDIDIEDAVAIISHVNGIKVIS